MSRMITDMVWDLEDGTAPEKAVLTALAHRADDPDGYSFPGVADIAAKTRLSRSTVLRALGSLEGQGLVKREKRWNPDGTQATNDYFIVVEMLAARLAQQRPLTKAEMAWLEEKRFKSKSSRRRKPTLAHRPVSVPKQRAAEPEQVEPSGSSPSVTVTPGSECHSDTQNRSGTRTTYFVPTGESFPAAPAAPCGARPAPSGANLATTDHTQVFVGDPVFNSSTYLTPDRARGNGSDSEASGRVQASWRKDRGMTGIGFQDRAIERSRRDRAERDNLRDKGAA